MMIRCPGLQRIHYSDLHPCGAVAWLRPTRSTIGCIILASKADAKLWCSGLNPLRRWVGCCAMLCARTLHVHKLFKELVNMQLMTSCAGGLDLLP